MDREYYTLVYNHPDITQPGPPIEPQQGWNIDENFEYLFRSVWCKKRNRRGTGTSKHTTSRGNILSRTPLITVWYKMTIRRSVHSSSAVQSLPRSPSLPDLRSPSLRSYLLSRSQTIVVVYRVQNRLIVEFELCMEPHKWTPPRLPPSTPHLHPFIQSSIQPFIHSYTSNNNNDHVPGPRIEVSRDGQDVIIRSRIIFQINAKHEIGRRGLSCQNMIRLGGLLAVQPQPSSPAGLPRSDAVTNDQTTRPSIRPVFIMKPSRWRDDIAVIDRYVSSPQSYPIPARLLRQLPPRSLQPTRPN